MDARIIWTIVVGGVLGLGFLGLIFKIVYDIRAMRLADEEAEEEAKVKTAQLKKKKRLTIGARSSGKTAFE
jgi:hypothetical protein